MAPLKQKNKLESKSEVKDPKFIYLASGALVCALCFVLIFLISYTKYYKVQYDSKIEDSKPNLSAKDDKKVPEIPAFDVVAYDKKILDLANHPFTPVSTSTSTTTPRTASTTAHFLWPVKTVYPNAGAILPFKRIIAYYGNFYSKGMGVLGEYPRAEMIAKLKVEINKWNKADPSTEAIPAIDYIATTAQGSPGKQGFYMLRMPDEQIDRAVDIAHEVNGIVILDVQVGLSSLQKELPMLEKYLMMPEVHLAIDPEFSMKTGAKPGTVVGTFDATDVNYAVNYLAKLVRDNNLPPKILIVHRFTQNMVTGYKQIKPLPEVQIVMDMDGWGSPAKKINTYRTMIYPEPVQFTGFKLFYKNDLKAPSTRLLTPEDLLKLQPIPSFIQYQ